MSVQYIAIPFNKLTLNMYHYGFPFQEFIKLVWRIGASLCSVCFLQRHFIWILDCCGLTFYI